MTAGGGEVYMPSLRDFGSLGLVNVNINIGTEGLVHVGNLLLNNDRLQLQAFDSLLKVDGGIYVATHSGTHMQMASGSEIRLGEDFVFGATSESNLRVTEGVFHFQGSGVQLLEVGGTDIGVGVSEHGEFSMGRLLIGTEEQPTTLMLLDLFDNGNRGELGKEAVYLNGVGGLDGLEIAEGSKIVLNGLNLYAYQEEEWIHINSLFQDGQTEVNFSGGVIAIPEPDTHIILMVGAFMAIAFLRSRVL